MVVGLRFESKAQQDRHYVVIPLALASTTLSNGTTLAPLVSPRLVLEEERRSGRISERDLIDTIFTSGGFSSGSDSQSSVDLFGCLSSLNLFHRLVENDWKHVAHSVWWRPNKTVKHTELLDLVTDSVAVIYERHHRLSKPFIAEDGAAHLCRLLRAKDMTEIEIKAANDVEPLTRQQVNQIVRWISTTQQRVLEQITQINIFYTHRDQAAADNKKITIACMKNDQAIAAATIDPSADSLVIVEEPFDITGDDHKKRVWTHANMKVNQDDIEAYTNYNLSQRKFATVVKNIQMRKSPSNDDNYNAKVYLETYFGSLTYPIHKLNNLWDEDEESQVHNSVMQLLNKGLSNNMIPPDGAELLPLYIKGRSFTGAWLPNTSAPLVVCRNGEPRYIMYYEPTTNQYYRGPLSAVESADGEGSSFVGQQQMASFVAQQQQQQQLEVDYTRPVRWATTGEASITAFNTRTSVMITELESVGYEIKWRKPNEMEIYIPVTDGTHTTRVKVVAKKAIVTDDIVDPMTTETAVEESAAEESISTTDGSTARHTKRRSFTQHMEARDEWLWELKGKPILTVRLPADPKTEASQYIPHTDREQIDRMFTNEARVQRRYEQHARQQRSSKYHSISTGPNSQRFQSGNDNVTVRQTENRTTNITKKSMTTIWTSRKEAESHAETLRANASRRKHQTSMKQSAFLQSMEDLTSHDQPPPLPTSLPPSMGRASDWSLVPQDLIDTTDAPLPSRSDAAVQSDVRLTTPKAQESASQTIELPLTSTSRTVSEHQTDNLTHTEVSYASTSHGLPATSDKSDFLSYMLGSSPSLSGQDQAIAEQTSRITPPTPPPLPPQPQTQPISPPTPPPLPPFGPVVSNQSASPVLAPARRTYTPLKVDIPPPGPQPSREDLEGITVWVRTPTPEASPRAPMEASGPLSPSSSAYYPIESPTQPSPSPSLPEEMPSVTSPFDADRPQTPPSERFPTRPELAASAQAGGPQGSSNTQPGQEVFVRPSLPAETPGAHEPAISRSQQQVAQRRQALQRPPLVQRPQVGQRPKTRDVKAKSKTKTSDSLAWASLGGGNVASPIVQAPTGYTAYTPSTYVAPSFGGSSGGRRRRRRRRHHKRRQGKWSEHLLRLLAANGPVMGTPVEATEQQPLPTLDGSLGVLGSTYPPNQVSDMSGVVMGADDGVGVEAHKPALQNVTGGEPVGLMGVPLGVTAAQSVGGRLQVYPAMYTLEYAQPQHGDDLNLGVVNMPGSTAVGVLVGNRGVVETTGAARASSVMSTMKAQPVVGASVPVMSTVQPVVGASIPVVGTVTPVMSSKTTTAAAPEIEVAVEFTRRKRLTRHA